MKQHIIRSNMRFVGCMVITGCVMLAIFTGCASDISEPKNDSPVTKEFDTRIGQWTNRYPNDKRIVGVWIQQFPDNDFDAPRYEGKHPCMVYYVFPDGRDHGIHYHPDGTIEYEGWSESPVWMLEQLEIVYRPDVLKTLIERAKTKKKEAQQVAPSNR